MSRSVIFILQRLYNFHQVTQLVDIMCGYLSPHCMLCECEKHMCVHSLKHYLIVFGNIVIEILQKTTDIFLPNEPLVDITIQLGV